MLRFRMPMLALAAVSGAILAGAGWAGVVAAQTGQNQNAQPMWDETHNQRPTAPSDRALPAGALSLRTTTTAPGVLSVFVHNGLPFDVVVSQVNATQCVNIVPADCGPIGTEIRVAAGAEALVRNLRQADPALTYGITPTYAWRPAVAAK